MIDQFYVSKCMMTFLTILNQIKIYHWQTLLHPRHKATDELYQNLSELIDKFIEVLMGRLIIENNNENYRIKINNNQMKLKDMNDNQGLSLMNNIKSYLESIELNLFLKNDTELLNIRDEMLGEINKTIYLFTLH